MNRRKFLIGVAATPLVWALQQYASTHTELTFTGFVKRGPGTGALAAHWDHMVWTGGKLFINGELIDE